MARRLRVTENGKRYSFTGPDTESAIQQFLQYGGDSASRHDTDALVSLLVMHDEFRLGEQLFQWDWTHPELDYCTVPKGYYFQ